MSANHSKHQFLTEALEGRKKERRFRELRAVLPDEHAGKVIFDDKTMINFCSNDYLSLSRHPRVIENSQAFTHKYGAGSTASRLVSGNFSIHENLEKKLAQTLDVEAALLFNTGFQANTTVLSTVAGRNSLILADKKIHSSLLQGAILSRSELKRYDHNDHDHLEQFLKEGKKGNYDRIWIVSETVFSMDGDRNKLEHLIKLAEQYDALLFSDDAHALGVLGHNGLGLNYGQEGIDISLGTFGKAFGSFGAFVGCSQEMKEYLINFCPGFIYTTALPPSVIGALDAALDLIPKMEEERRHVMELVSYFKEEIHSLGFDTGASNSQIIPVIIGDEQETLNISQYLENEGFYATAIRPPTVPTGASRIRITINSGHTKEQIKQLIQAFGTYQQ